MNDQSCVGNLMTIFQLSALELYGYYLCLAKDCREYI